MSTCDLCDLPTPNPPVTGENVDGVFCCRGCLEVFRTLGNVDASAVDADDLRTTPKGERDADPPENAETTYLEIDGMHCATCETFIEAIATDRTGIHAAEASYATDMARLTYDPSIVDVTSLPEVVSGLGYHASLPDADEEEQDDIHTNWRLYLGALLGMQIMMIYVVFLYPTYYGLFPTAPGASLPILLWILGWGAVVVFWVGLPILRGAYVSLRTRQPNMDLLIALGVLIPYLYSITTVLLGGHEIYVDVSTMIVVVVTAGNYVEHTFKQNAVETITTLTRTRVSEARLQDDDGTIRTIDIEDCEPGDTLLVKPGEQIPVDGTVVEGTAAVDQALITGESMPETKHPGDAVVGGSTVTDGSLMVTVGEDATSTLDQLVELLWNVQSTTTGMQRLADRIAHVFVPLVMVLALATTVGWLVAGHATSGALLTGVAVLVVSCPCSFGLATPLAIVSGIREAAERDIVILNTAALEGIQDTDIVAFDKTGTLTTGEMQVVDIVADDEEDLLARAAAVEVRASHPVADAIVATANPIDATVQGFERHGQGVSARVNGERVVVGSLGYFREEGWVIPKTVSQAVERAHETGKLPVAVGWDRSVRGVIAVSDTPRADWEEVIERIAEEDRRVVIITGDDEVMARRFEAHHAVDEVLSEVRPEAKVAVVERLCADGTTTMVGDGINDAPALASADFGIAMSNGTDIAINAADAVIMSDDLMPVVDAFEIAAETRRRVRQNFGWAISYNVIAIPIAIAGLLNPLLASLTMTVSSIAVVRNSSRKLLDR
jgi:Cu2+-exporting ATPase